MSRPSAKPPSSYAIARTKREEARAERERLELGIRRGQYVPASQVEAAWSQLVMAFRSRLLALPTALAAAAAACEHQPRAVVFEEATRLVYAALTELGGLTPEELLGPPPARGRSRPTTRQKPRRPPRP